MCVYGETSYFHKSFLKNFVLLNTPWVSAEIREYWTSQVFNSTPSARNPCFAAAEEIFKHFTFSILTNFTQTIVYPPITTLPSPEPISSNRCAPFFEFPLIISKIFSICRSVAGTYGKQYLRNAGATNDTQITLNPIAIPPELERWSINDGFDLLLVGCDRSFYLIIQ